MDTGEAETAVVFQQQWREANVPAEDVLGRVQLHSFGLKTWLSALRVPFREVPGEYWTLDNEGGFSGAVVACPCGMSPFILAGTWSACGGDECQRAYAFTGSKVFVLNPVEPAVTESEPEPDAPS